MNVNYANSDSKGGAASTVKDWGAADSNSDRHVWFSYDGDDTKKVNSDKFKYNPATNKLTVGSITGSSASCTGNAATATKLAASKTISLSGDVKGSTSFDGSANITIASTLAANYAGSSSKGGAATSANKLNTNAGSTTLPVYFADGIPKAINKTDVGISITGNAATASKLASARTISISGVTTGSTTFDGSKNITINTSFNRHTIDSSNKNNYPFKRIASVVVGTNNYSDCNMIIRVTEEFSGGLTGVCKIAIRTNSANADVQGTAEWIETNSKDIPKIYIGILGKTGENVVADIYYKCRSTYARTQFEVISARKGNWTLYSPKEVNNTTTTDKLTSVESYASVEEGGTIIRESAYTSIAESSIVSCASKLSAGYGASNVPIYIDSNGIPAAIGYQINKTVPSNAVFTDTTYSSGNGITIDGNRKINHSNTITAKTTYGSTATTASANGGSITVTDVKYDAYGHITGSTDRTIKLSQTVYSLPTAGSTLGGVKTTSTVTNASGYTACPIIGGVPYYKDTNTTYSLSSFGITASAAELNYCKGVTSAIQTQLNGKANSSHSHDYLPISGGTLTGPLVLPYMEFMGQTNGGYIDFHYQGSTDDYTSRIVEDIKGRLWIESNMYVNGTITANKVYGAVWNDYAEFRISDCLEPGRVVCENGNDTLSISTKRLQPGANVISDTYGFSIGETDEAKCPIAVSGRVLAYGYENRELFRKNIGHPVCAGPNGTVSIMTDEEYKNYGYCAIGTISAVPDYEEWGTGKVKVDNRIWIKI